jgi:hypothetical protein
MNFAIHSGIPGFLPCSVADSASASGRPDWREIAAAGTSLRGGHHKAMNIHH